MGGPSGTVTFLFTDVEGSTRLWETAPDGMRAALERHDAILRSAFDGHGGFVFATGGDGFGVAFARAGDALAAAVEAQRALAVEPWPMAAPLRVRMGVHTGETVERDGDYFGPAVNRAARLMAVAHGGQVVCSQATAVLAEPSVGLRGLGEHRLRDLGAAEPVFQVGGGLFPPLRSVDVVPTNLPTVRTELIGRSDDIASLSSLVGRAPLVTLTGVGGVGKTRLALAVAAALAPGFVDGCWLVELAPVGDGGEVAKTVSGAVGASMTDRAALVSYLSDRRMLVVLDNCEHVLADTADLVDAVLAAAPDMHVLVTSREPLGVDGEQVRRVQSLAVPAHDAAVEVAVASPAVRLFGERAAAVSERFALGPGNVAAVVEICRHLDGIPLAIELAAARVAAMPPAEIAARLGERFRLLAGGSRRGQERHRTLLAAVSWSHDLLAADEKIVFRRLAVFPASFDLAAAEAVAGGGEGIDVLDTVVRLVARSMVQYDDSSGRYRLLETLRQYAADRLGEAAETLAARDTHTRFFCDLVERLAPGLLDARHHDTVARLLPELDNLRAAAAWLADTGRFDELQRLARRAFMLMQVFAPADGARWLRHAIDGRASTEDQELVDATGELAMLTLTVGEIDAALRLAERSIRLAGERGLPASPWAWLTKVLRGTFRDDPQGSVDAARAGLAVATARHDEPAASFMEAAVVSPLAALGDLDASQAAADHSLAVALRTGNPVVIGGAVMCAAAARLYNRDPPDCAGALDILQRNTHHHRLGDDNFTGMWLELMRGLALVGGQHGTAVSLLARCLRTADRLQALWAAELAVRLLVLDAARCGKTETAATLLGYLDTNLTAYRTQAAGLVWLDRRIDDALDTLAAEARDLHHARGATLTRRDLMSLVETLERTAAQPE